jgi:hypothetical protein
MTVWEKTVQVLINAESAVNAVRGPAADIPEEDAEDEPQAGGQPGEAVPF